jgi:poly(3-hydroxybutyrate) depolymerase
LLAGGAMTSVMLTTCPEVFAGGAIIAGLPYGCASTALGAFHRTHCHGGRRGDNLQNYCARSPVCRTVADDPNLAGQPRPYDRSIERGSDRRTAAYASYSDRNQTAPPG